MGTQCVDKCLKNKNSDRRRVIRSKPKVQILSQEFLSRVSHLFLSDTLYWEQFDSCSEGFKEKIQAQNNGTHFY